jgi:S1/P1 Nuclease
VQRTSRAAACCGRPALPPGTQASGGPAEDCVLDKIDGFKAELATSSTSSAERLEALQFLLHFVGDLHQPLHASDDQDQGGNKKQVTWTDANGVQQTGTLHHYWDALPETLGQGRDAIAASLIKKITSTEAKSWAKGTPDSWAKESFKAAVSTAYGLLPKPGGDGKYALDKKYAARADKVVVQRLQRAGVRLAAILNEALK